MSIDEERTRLHNEISGSFMRQGLVGPMAEKAMEIVTKNKLADVQMSDTGEPERVMHTVTRHAEVDDFTKTIVNQYGSQIFNGPSGRSFSQMMK